MIRSRDAARRAVAWAAGATAVAAFAGDAHAVFWNNDPAFGTTSAAGLTDRPIGFPNAYRVYNDDANARGTGILLNSEWALTVHHVIESSAGYNPLSTPNYISLYVEGAGGGYFADQLFAPADGSEVALVHLRGGVNGTLNLQPYLNTSPDEAGRIVQIGGYGYYGTVNTTAAGGTVAGTSNTDASYHRAYNTIDGFNGNGQIVISQNNDATVRNNNLLEGIGAPGDSGGPMFGFYGSNFATQQNDITKWRLVGLTATSAAGSTAHEYDAAQYTRVSSFANWINSTIASYPTPAPSTTTAWVQDAGQNLYDTGRAKISVTNSSPPVVHAKFGPGGAGYTLGNVGDKISMTATLDTPVAMSSVQFRFGMFDDAGGTIPGNVSGGTPWRGYLVTNSAENDHQGPYEKGPNGGGTGSWWSIVNPNSGVLVGPGSQATGSFTTATAGNDPTPLGVYTLSLTYTRVAAGLQIDWSMVQTKNGTYTLNPTTGLYDETPTSGVYTYTGSVTDATPASASWTYDQLGFFLYGGTLTNQTIVLDNINVAFVPEPSATAALATGAAASLLAAARRSRRA